MRPDIPLSTPDGTVKWYSERVDDEDGGIRYEAHGPRDSFVVFEGPNARQDCDRFMRSALAGLKAKALAVAPVSTDFDAALGKRIRDLRKLRGTRRLTFAPLVGVSHQQLAKYENGSNRVSAEGLVRIAGALGVPVGELVEGLSTTTERKDQ